MNQTEQLPFAATTVRDTRQGLDFDSGGEEARRIFLERIKDGYLRDRHLIPGPAQIILDIELQGIERWVTRYGYLGEIITMMGSFTTMLLLVRTLMALQKPPSAPLSGASTLGSVCRN